MINNSIFRAFERMWQHILSALGNKADIYHSHDDMYYTETEIDERFTDELNKIPARSNEIYGYYIIAFDTANNTITISTSPDGSGLPNANVIARWLEPASFISGEEITNQYVSFDAAGFYALYSKIIGYNATTGTITVDKLPLDDSNFNPTIPSEREDNTEYIIYAPLTPNAGEVLLFADQLQQGNGNAVGYGAVGINYAQAIAPYSFAANRKTIAGYGAASFGQGSEALANYSIAQGQSCKTEGNNFGHAEGAFTIARGKAAHTEGRSTRASGTYAHAEGEESIASGEAAHAEGYSTEAIGVYSHSEGYNTEANGQYSHAEGYQSKIEVVEGKDSNAAHAEGYTTTAKARAAHSEGAKTVAAGICSHTEGNTTKAGGEVTLDGETVARTGTGNYAHAEGANAVALGESSHSEGNTTRAIGKYSHSEGSKSVAIGTGSHAEGSATKATGNHSHSEGYNNIASGEFSHSEGYETEASGRASHAEGAWAIAEGLGSHAEGRGTHTTVDYQHVQGKYNYLDADGSSGKDYAHIVGGGTKTDRKNIYTLDWTGNAVFTGSITTNGNNFDSAFQFEITYDDGTTKTIKVLGAEV